jgi:hypothetical protein
MSESLHQAARILYQQQEAGQSILPSRVRLVHTRLSDLDRMITRITPALPPTPPPKNRDPSAPGAPGRHPRKRIIIDRTTTGRRISFEDEDEEEGEEEPDDEEDDEESKDELANLTAEQKALLEDEDGEIPECTRKAYTTVLALLHESAPTGFQLDAICKGTQIHMMIVAPVMDVLISQGKVKRTEGDDIPISIPYYQFVGDEETESDEELEEVSSDTDEEEEPKQQKAIDVEYKDYTPVQTKVLDFFKIRFDQDVAIADLKDWFKNESYERLVATVAFLYNEGEIYNTLTENHYRYVIRDDSNKENTDPDARAKASVMETIMGYIGYNSQQKYTVTLDEIVEIGSHNRRKTKRIVQAMVDENKVFAVTIKGQQCYYTDTDLEQKMKGYTSLQAMALKYVISQSRSAGDIGVPLYDIEQELNENDVECAMTALVNEGEVYTTIDEQHYLYTNAIKEGEQTKKKKPTPLNMDIEDSDNESVVLPTPPSEVNSPYAGPVASPQTRSEQKQALVEALQAIVRTGPPMQMHVMTSGPVVKSSTYVYPNMSIAVTKKQTGEEEEDKEVKDTTTTYVPQSPEF